MTAEVTAEMNVDSRGYVACSADHFTGSGDHILIRRVTYMYTFTCMMLHVQISKIMQLHIDT